MSTTTSANASVERDVNMFKEFLRIKTMHPNPDLKQCVAWLQDIGRSLGMTSQVVEFVPNRPVLVMSLAGLDPSLPSIGLNCHMDVVPVVAERWDKLPADQTPFSAWEDADGKIYARGSQDMKCVGAQYLAALRRLVEGGQRLLRTVHTIWVPDEEIGGEDGMRRFVQSPEFRALRLGCVMDEGLAFPENKFVVFTGERTSLWATLSAVGPVGHASKLIENTAFDRLSRAMTRITALRDKNVEKLTQNPELRLGDVTTFNITVVNGGTTNDGGKTFAPNVIPSDAFLIADIRIALEDYTTVIQEIKSICKDFQLTMKATNEFDELAGPSPYSDRNSVWMQTIETAIRASVSSGPLAGSSSDSVVVERAIFPAATDSRYVRRVGVPAFGFSPMRRTPSLLHDHNEYLERSVFLEGILIMQSVIQQLASVTGPAAHKL